MGSPDAIQPPITAPTNPSSSAVTAVTAAWRAASAAATASTGAGRATHTGVPASPPYQEPRYVAAPNDVKISSKGSATSHTMAPCNMAVSDRLKPATLHAAQPPVTNARNAPNTLQNRVPKPISLHVPIGWAIRCAPIAIPTRPKITASAMAESAPIQIALHETGQAWTSSSPFL